jgi:CubicO group peptidase (beta-lactamase class C family)
MPSTGMISLLSRRPLAGAFAAFVLAAPAVADPPSGVAHTLALAAGYKAAFLCSGIFAAGQSEAQVTADDLEGIYPEYQAAVSNLPARIDRAARTVSVAFEESLPPRIAAWRPGLGCAQLPVGADARAIASLPRLALSPPPAGADARSWPDGEAGAAPRAVSQRLEAVAARAFDGATYGAGSRTTAVVVVRDGRILAERYRPGYGPTTPQRTWSAAKSLTATLIGRAVALDLVKVDAPAPIPEWRAPGDPRAAITLRNLLNMASGLFTDGPGNRTDGIYVGGAEVTEAATAMPLEAAPGSRFHYANDDALLAARALRAVNGDGQRALQFPYTELLWRIGMDHTTLETDWRGNYVLSSQVWSTARDLGRLGLLYLNDGVWDGRRLLPRGWARFVATPAPAQPEGAARGGPGYGAFFWLYGPRQGLPPGTYAMEGNRGQYVFIVPTRHMVIVRRGFDSAAGGQAFDAAKFVCDVLAATG